MCVGCCIVLLQEIVTYEKNKMSEELDEAVIREVASTRCGGDDKLDKAMKRGDVTQTIDKKGREVFIFPSSTIADRSSTKTAEVAKRFLADVLVWLILLMQSLNTPRN